MDVTVALSLLQEGLTNGAVYSLIALALVLVFAVTRVILVQAGEFVSFSALTLYALQSSKVPPTLWLMVAACVGAGIVELTRLSRSRAPIRSCVRPLIGWFLAPWVVVLATFFCGGSRAVLLQIGLTLAIVVPLGPAMYRLVYQPVAHATILVLLIVSVACHFVLDGLALVAFGPDGARTQPFTDASLEIAGQTVSVQSLLVIVITAVLAVVLFWFSQRTMYGTALRATASSRRGAALIGIGADTAGITSFTLTALICAIAGVLISPFVTIYYNSGFIISLKAFVGATVGALASYPLAAAGAVAIGLFESFAAFWSSGYKEAMVFALMVPILFACSLLTRQTLDEEEEKAASESNSSSSTVRRLLSPLAAVPSWAWTVIAVVALALVPLLLSRFYVTLVSYICLYTVVCYGVVLLTGVAGQVSFGQAAFVGIGAYTSALITMRLGVSPWLALPVALAVTAAGAWLLGVVTLRMRGHYLPIATIAWATSLFYVFTNTDAIGGSTGMTDLPRLELPISKVSQIGYEAAMYYVIAAVMVLTGWMTANLLDSRTGRAIRALKSKVVMAESMGIDVPALKIKVFICSAIFAGLSGWLYAHMQRFINPSSFGLDMGTQYVFMSVVGGVEQVLGAPVGAALVRVVNDWLQDILRAGIFERAGNVERVFFGVLIILLLQRTQHGLAYLFASLGRAPKTSARKPSPAPSASVPGSSTVARGSDGANAGGPLLVVKDVSKNFGGLAAVAGMSFDVAPGEIVALIGPNGAGKSTMFNLISGALGLSSGRIDYAGARIDGLSSHAIATAGLSRTFQHVKLLTERTVLENVALGSYRLGRAGLLSSMLRLDREDEQRALERAQVALDKVGLGDAHALQAGSLPLGKQRILEIARALASEPRMLLLDEPAAGLRSGEKKELGSLLRGLRAEGMAILLVEHDMAFVMGLADRVVVQSFGRGLATGTPSAVQKHPDVIAAYLGSAA